MPRKARYQREKKQAASKLIQEQPSAAVKRAAMRGPEAALKRTVKELARVHTADAIEALAKIMRKSKYPGLQLAAIEQLLNRGWGKPANSITGEDGEGAVTINISEIRRTIVDPVEFDEDEAPVRHIGSERADMATIKKRVNAINQRKLN